MKSEERERLVSAVGREEAVRVLIVEKWHNFLYGYTTYLALLGFVAWLILR